MTVSSRTVALSMHRWGWHFCYEVRHSVSVSTGAISEGETERTDLRRGRLAARGAVWVFRDEPLGNT
eukprot:6198754-Pleurochrysis_carterae.AAC.3